MNDEKKALEQIKAVYDDGTALINGREYKFLGTTHIVRRRVFAYFTKIQGQLQQGDFSFLSSAEFEQIEKDINNMVTFNDNLLSKIKNHWEEFPEDYIPFISTALGVISYPFLRGILTV